MFRRFRNPPPDKVHPPVARYHHRVEVSPGKWWMVLSGQVGIRPDGQVPEDPIEQLEVALENVRQNLFDGYMQVEDVVKLTIYLVGDVDPERRRAVLDKWLARHTPTMTVVYVVALASPEYRVEVEAWAAA